MPPRAKIDFCSGVQNTKVLLAALALWGWAACAHAEDCAFDRANVLAMDVETFDQAPRGWRALGERAGCESAAADLIAAYREANAIALVNSDPDTIALLNWHEGQLRAVAGQTRQAIDRMNAAGMNANPANALYVQATAAFLARRRDALLSIRTQLAALPEPEWFADVQAQQRASGREVSWPPNLDVVDGLIACYDQPYRDAYSEQCRH